jgi:hypothetical protein
MRTRPSALLAGWLILVSNSVFAAKIAEVVLWNGNTITGEVKSLQQGKLKFKTDHAGTIYIEWEFVNSVTSTNFFEVPTSSRWKTSSVTITTGCSLPDPRIKS